MLVKPKAGTPTASDHQALFSCLVSVLEKHAIKAYVKEAERPLSDSESWAITADSSLDEVEGFC